MVQQQTRSNSTTTKKCVGNNSTNPHISPEFIDPTNLKLFAKVMPLWHKRIMESTTWTELSETKKMKGKNGKYVELDKENPKTSMIGEVQGFSIDYMKKKGSYDLDPAMMPFADTFRQLIRMGAYIEAQEKDAERDNVLTYTRRAFSSQIDICMNYLRTKYPGLYTIKNIMDTTSDVEI